tara:strand:- start:5081 stop:5500 length:420 start_codon:yes stop_codon:yes gene_type:complete
MAKKTQQTQLADEIATVATSAAPPIPAAPAAAPEVTPDQIAQLILKGSEDTKAAIRKALDLDKTHSRQRKSQTTNSQVRNTVRAIGEVTHAEGFIPAPPSRITDRGPEAVRVWTERWFDNNGDNLSEYDLDHMALDATL